MTPLVLHEGLVVPVDASSVDTDTLVPRQYLKRVERSGLAPYLFDRWRYLDRGTASDDPYLDCAGRVPDPEFPLNQARYQGASVLLTQANFGCGSSREQAVWAIAELGIRVLIGSSFGDIFVNNCYSNGLLPVVLEAGAIDTLFGAVRAQPGYSLRIDLPAQTVIDPSLNMWRSHIDASRKNTLLEGLDSIGATLSKTTDLERFESKRWRRHPWLAEPVRPFELHTAERRRDS